MAYPNWFAHYAERYFEWLTPQLGGGEIRRMVGAPLQLLQIGAFTGDASVWLLDHFPTAHLTDVDTWAGSDEAQHEPFDWADVEATYDEKMVDYPVDRHWKYKGTSRSFFRDEWDTGAFDFIYIDGDHTAVGVLEDAVDAIPLLKVGGLIAFDDYLWESDDRDPLKSPRLAVDAIASIYGDRLERLDAHPWIDPPDLQVWFRKVAA